MPETPRTTLIAAFASIYIIWGSTYLAIRVLIDTLPGFIMMGGRFLLAGLMLGGVAWLRGARLPTARQWRHSTVLGFSLLLFGNGAVVWAAEFTNSGLLALLVGMEPLWLAILLGVFPAGRKGPHERPNLITFLALGLGFAGVAVLAAPGDVLAGSTVHLPSVLAISIGCLSWAAGSLYGRFSDAPSSASINSAAQMITGGAMLLAVGILRGEWSQFRPTSASFESVIAFIYLVVFGSIIAFSAYAWLVRNVEPTLIATHTYVNPVVAVFLGWWLAGEELGSRVLIAATLIVASVVVLTASEARRARRYHRRIAAGEAPD